MSFREDSPDKDYHVETYYIRDPDKLGCLLSYLPQRARAALARAFWSAPQGSLGTEVPGFGMSLDMAREWATDEKRRRQAPPGLVFVAEPVENREDLDDF